MSEDENKERVEQVLHVMEATIVPFISDAVLSKNEDVLEYLERKGVANLDETSRFCHEGNTEETKALTKKGLAIDFLFVLFDRFNREMLNAAKREKQSEQCESAKVLAKALTSRLDIN